MHIQNDLLLGIEKKQITTLVLIDLSAAFDAIDHESLVDFKTPVSITGSANNLLLFLIFEMIKVTQNSTDNDINH